MGDSTLIAWTDKTQNFWRGCDKVSPGCAHCYMYEQMKRVSSWDPTIPVRTKTWNDSLRWQREAAAKGIIWRVFTCSWSDFFHPTADPWRDEAWDVIRRCPNLHYQILTKRPENIAARLPKDWGPDGWPNVWLGVSIENQKFAYRADILREHPAVVRFLSMEPLLAPVLMDMTGIDWVIVGGESGPGYRPMDHEWARLALKQTREAGAAFFFKQSAAPRTEMGIKLETSPGVFEIVREYPTPRRSLRGDVGPLLQFATTLAPQREQK